MPAEPTRKAVRNQYDEVAPDGTWCEALNGLVQQAECNHQLAVKEARSYAHNAKCAVQLLIGSIPNLEPDVRAYAKP